jgi:hypothetical protein
MSLRLIAVLVGVPATAIVACGIVLPLGAQTPATLIGRVEDVAVYSVFPVNRSATTFARTAYGFEFSFLVGTETKPFTRAERQARCIKLLGKPQPEGTTERCDVGQNNVIKTRVVQVRRGPAGAITDSTFEVTVSPLEHTRWQFELAVGNQVTDLRHTDPRDGWQLTGTINEFPSIALYGAYRPDRDPSPYFGLRFTLADLKNARIFQSDSTATVEATSVGGSVAAGLVHELLPRFNVFGEVSYSYLRFNTARWNLPANLRPQPASFPRTLELTGLRFSVGLQIGISDDK